MAVNKNFVIKNGLEVDQKLILADATTQKVGIGSTGPRFELDVAGGIGATDSYIIGISTALEYFNVGLGGKVLSVVAGAGGIGTSKVGIGTSNPNYLLEVRSPVNTGQTALYVYGDFQVSGDILADDINLDDAQIQNLTVTEALNVTSPGISTFGGYVDINNSLDISTNLNVVGLTTLGGYVDINSSVDTSGTLNVGSATTIGGYLDINSNTDISGTLNVGGATTIGGYVDINNSIDISNNLNVSGIATIANVSITGATLSTLSVSGQSILGVTSVSQLNVSGVGTIATLNSTNANLTNISGTNLNYSGIGTINTLIVGTQANKSTISYTTNAARTLTIPSLGGNRTFAFINQDQTFSGNQNFTNINVSGTSTIANVDINSGDIEVSNVDTTNLNVSGISTLGNLRISTGIVTATSGVVTFYGDGSGLFNTPPGSPAGSINQVQYNDGVSFAGSPNLTHDGTTTRIVTGVVTEVYGNNLYYTNGALNAVFGNNLNYSTGFVGDISGNNLYYTGIGTISTFDSTIGSIASVSGVSLNYSGDSTIANLSGTNINISGIITSTSYVVTGGTSSQFLKADGSVDSSLYTSTGKAIAMAIVFG